MAVISAIQNHNHRVYLGVQFLLAAAAICAIYGFFFGERSSVVGWALAFCLLAIVCGAGTLVYLRYSLSVRLREASELEISKQQLFQTDALTGAMTRRHFLDMLSEALGQPLKPKPAILLLVDLDHFKQLNDSFGHQFGDQALTHLVEGMKHFFPDAAIGRLGGDEFGIVMRNGTVEAATERAEHLLDMLRQGRLHEGNRIPLSASIGIAVAPHNADNSKELLALADLALYDSKSEGRGRVTLFRNDLVTEIRRRRYVERELRAAVYMNELELHYQPVVGADGSAIAVEGLVRWRHPVRGIISPAEFIPVAERSALIDLVGEWVFRRACLDVDDFPGCSISINVSGEQLKRDEIVAMMRRTLAETGRSADQFVIEITETVATAVSPEVLKRLQTLKEMGFRIALDDFGTGHCGFNYLQTLPIDSIKVDRSYVRNLGKDGIAQVFVSALAQIARMRDLTIVAEGIENEAEFQRARTAGCTLFQGYHFGRPAPIRSAYQRARGSARQRPAQAPHALTA